MILLLFVEWDAFYRTDNRSHFVLQSGLQVSIQQPESYKILTILVYSVMFQFKQIRFPSPLHVQENIRNLTPKTLKASSSACFWGISCFIFYLLISFLSVTTCSIKKYTTAIRVKTNWGPFQWFKIKMCFFTFKLCPWWIYYTLIIVFLFTISSLTNLTVCSLYFNWYTLTKLKSAYYVFKQIILCIAGIYSKVHAELNFVLRLMPWPKSSKWGFHLCIDNLVIKVESSNSFFLGIRLYWILQDSVKFTM